MNENQKAKIDRFKKSAKTYAPLLIPAAATIAFAVCAYSVGKTVLASDGAFEPLPEITGEEREKLLAREDTRITKIEDNLYFLEIPETED